MAPISSGTSMGPSSEAPGRFRSWFRVDPINGASPSSRMYRPSSSQSFRLRSHIALQPFDVDTMRECDRDVRVSGRIELSGSDFLNSQCLIPISLTPLCSIEWFFRRSRRNRFHLHEGGFRNPRSSTTVGSKRTLLRLPRVFGAASAPRWRDW